MSKAFENIKDFELVFKEYYNPLINFVNRYLSNFENSREVVQMTFVKVWENRLNLHIKTSVKSYLYQSAKNTMIDFIRKNKIIFNATEFDGSLSNSLLDDNPDQLDPYIIKNAVETALKNVKPKAREIFSLHKFEGLTYQEIAEYLNISKRSVEDNVAKTLKILKDQLKNHPDLYE
ncbi:MAG: sigma-70 family RNA polymerase sigma factor [Saprospiraceae bacterium]|nr:sigma-70 family RNA polymerase sigma factor [Saprospiraceae bacterium]MBL0026730.1 sigma-70 family RNA polymerase sigma factor [Saprospiraceae bacterium]